METDASTMLHGLAAAFSASLHACCVFRVTVCVAGRACAAPWEWFNRIMVPFHDRAVEDANCWLDQVGPPLFDR